MSAGPVLSIKPLVWLQVVQQAAGAETVAAVRDAMHAELEASMREAASAEAIAQARAEAQVHAQKQLAALMAQQAAGDCAASISAASTANHQAPEADTRSAAGWEDTERARNALEVQQAELAHYADEIAAEREEGLALEAKIKAIEDKVSSTVLLTIPMRIAVPWLAQLTSAACLCPALSPASCRSFMAGRICWRWWMPWTRLLLSRRPPWLRSTQLRRWQLLASLSWRATS